MYVCVVVERGRGVGRRYIPSKVHLCTQSVTPHRASQVGCCYEEVNEGRHLVSQVSTRCAKGKAISEVSGHCFITGDKTSVRHCRWHPHLAMFPTLRGLHALHKALRALLSACKDLKSKFA